jgi:hypothetical protein
VGEGYCEKTAVDFLYYETQSIKQSKKWINEQKAITKNRKIQKDRQHTEKDSREEQRPSGLTIFP